MAAGGLVAQTHLTGRFIASFHFWLGFQPIAHEELKRLRYNSVFGRSKISLPKIVNTTDEFIIEAEHC